VILELYAHVASPAHHALMRQAFLKGGSGYGVFKKQLFEALWEYLAPMRARRHELLRDPGYVDAVLKEGAQRANTIANHMLERVRKAVGLR
jgi:tryptophanyl-tRNA synthetase